MQLYNPLPKIAASFAFIAVLGFTSSSFATNDGSSNHGLLVDEKTREVNLNDSISQEIPVNIRLLDPNFDVRREKGRRQPWHDTKSIYLRRTVPVINLAAVFDPKHI
jgi:hypothetical protein